ncbi:MAG: ABC transporter ATP-binding protein [Rhizobiaceae bacterium]
MTIAPFLQVQDLDLAFTNTGAAAKVLHDISLHVMAGEKVALVGESGSGKSVTARIVAGLLRPGREAQVSGRVLLGGKDVLNLTEGEFRRLRGTMFSMIFQDPTSALNPLFPIRDQFREVLRSATPGVTRAETRLRATDLLRQVMLDDADRVLGCYPFQLSGGMNQRVMIAMALANCPQLILADEPGTALDVTVQDRTLKLMGSLTREAGTAVLFISHNLGVVREFADRIYVIYRGRIVEHGRTADIFSNPLHPYTRALFAAVPRIVGRGLPAAPREDATFDAPAVIHEGCAEPVIEEAV